MRSLLELRSCGQPKGQVEAPEDAHLISLIAESARALAPLSFQKGRRVPLNIRLRLRRWLS